MSNYRSTPVLHHVFNELDRIGLLLGLPRLEEEKNSVYKRRLFDVLVNRADSSYLGLINGITRELGLNIVDTMRIIPIQDSNGDFLAPVPAIVFDETKCYLYNDFSEGDILLTIDRFEQDEGAWTLGELRDTINTTAKYSATILDGVDTNLRSMMIYNQKSHDIVPSEEISGSGIVIKLENRNIVQSSLVISSENLFNRVSSQINLTKRGDFYVDYQSGIVYSYASAAPGDTIRYQFVRDNFIVKSSPVIIHSIQSADFRTKMFEQILDGEGDSVNGLPTPLGADIINELLSVYPTSWGK